MTVTNYTTPEELSTYLSLDSQSDQVLMDLFCDEASRMCEDSCGRRFNLDDAVSDRTYDVARLDSIATDDFATTSGLVVQFSLDNQDWQVVDPAGYHATPINALVERQEPWPFTGVATNNPAIRMFYGYFIKVTAQFGWPAVPSTIHGATLIQAARLWSRKDSPTGAESFGEGFSRTVKALDPDLDRMVQRYKRITNTDGFA